MKWIVSWQTVVHHSDGTWFEKTERHHHSKEFDDKEEAYQFRNDLRNARYVVNVELKREVSLDDIYNAIAAKN